MQALKVWEYDDIFNPVTDLNENFSKTKSAIDALEESSGSDVTRIAALEAQNGSETLTTTAQTLSGAVNELDADINTPINGLSAKVQTAQTDITSLKLQNGQQVLTTTAQTLSGAINELDDDLNHADTGVIARVGALETQAGNATLETTAQTLSGAINELDDDLETTRTLLNQIYERHDINAYTGTGETLCDALKNAFVEFMTIPSGKIRELKEIYIQGHGRFTPTQWQPTGAGTRDIPFISYQQGATSGECAFIVLRNAVGEPCTFRSMTVESGQVTFTDYSTQVESTSKQVLLKYVEYTIQ